MLRDVKLESLGFTREQLDSFRRELMEHDRDLLVKRLDDVTQRLSEVAPRVSEEAAADRREWNAREVLAHVAVLSKFYGVAAKKIAEGEWEDFDLLTFVSQRDVAGQQVSQLPVSEIVRMVEADHRRTLDFIRGADVAALYRRARIGDGETMSAEEVVRLALCAHLELHLQQLLGALGE